jgi:hypothetical protein
MSVALLEFRWSRILSAGGDEREALLTGAVTIALWMSLHYRSRRDAGRRTGPRRALVLATCLAIAVVVFVGVELENLPMRLDRLSEGSARGVVGIS